jgi:hypothetical protein
MRKERLVSGKQSSRGVRELQAGKEVLMKEKYTRAQPGHWHSPSRRGKDDRKTWRKMVSRGKPPSAEREESKTLPHLPGCGKWGWARALGFTAL